MVIACIEYLQNVIFIEEIRYSIHLSHEIEVDSFPTQFVISLDEEAVVIDRTSREPLIMKRLSKFCEVFSLKRICPTELKELPTRETYEDLIDSLSPISSTWRA